MRAEVLGLYLDGFLEVLDRLGATPLQENITAQIVIGFGKIRIYFNGAPVGLLRIEYPAGGRQGDAIIVDQLGVLGVLLGSIPAMEPTPLSLRPERST